MHAIAGSVVGLAQCFEFTFDMSQLGQPRFQRGGGLQGSSADTGLFVRGVAVFQEPQLVQLQSAFFLQLAVLQCHGRLALEFVKIGVEFAQDVVHTCEVLSRVFESCFCFTTAFFVLRNTRCFFQEQTQLFRARFNDPADRPLADDGVGAWAQTGAQEHVLHIAPAHDLVVDEVAGAALSREHTLDGNFSKLVPWPASPRKAVVEDKFNTRTTRWFAKTRAVEDDVLHRLATQLASSAFTQNPAHSVDDVGLAATVGANHAHALPRQLEGGGFCK